MAIFPLFLPSGLVLLWTAYLAGLTQSEPMELVRTEPGLTERESKEPGLTGAGSTGVASKHSGMTELLLARSAMLQCSAWRLESGFFAVPSSTRSVGNCRSTTSASGCAANQSFCPLLLPAWSAGHKTQGIKSPAEEPRYG